MHTLPNWIVADENKPNSFIVDPDIFYPEILAELGIDVASVDQHDLETAYNIMKIDAQYHIHAAGVDPRPEKSLNISVTGKAGHKERWGQAGKPKGKMEAIEAEHGDNAWRQVAKDSREKYKSLRGFIPA